MVEDTAGCAYVSESEKRNDTAPNIRVRAEFEDMLTTFRACVAERCTEQAIRYFDQTLSYHDVDVASDTLALWLLDHGVSLGDRVAIVLQNMPQFVLMVVAAWKVGAIPVPCNPMYKRTELARILGDCEPSAMVCLDSIYEEVRGALSLASLDAAILVTACRALQGRNDPRVFAGTANVLPGAELLEEVIARKHEKPPHIGLDGDELGLLLYTSGTTGQPKGAMITHRSLAFNGQAMRSLCGLTAESRVLGIAPLFHITGMSCQIAAALSARATLVLHYRVEPSLLLDVIRDHRPTFTIGSITAFNALMNVPGILPADMASFDRIYSGGAPIPPALLHELEDRLGVRIHSSYGMTETTAHTHLAPYLVPIPVDPTSGALSIGKPTPQTDAKIVDDEGRELGAGAVGQLLIHGPQVMAGYWRKKDETATVLAGGWMHTGDVAFRDDQGWFYLVDRMKDVIIASGFKVWPREVEDVLYAHSAVREAGVVGVPDAYRGETVKAYVSLKPGSAVDPQTLIDHCRGHLAAYKAPRSVEILEDLPKTVTGKIRRLALRTQSAPALTR